MKQFRIWIDNNWRAILSRAPLPMLALAASWGVYSFAAMYVPQWVAIVQAAAFELTYIGLAITRGLTDEQRKRATAISIGAVVVSVLYNSIDGFFVRNPTWLIGLPWEAEALGAFLHGAPLAVVAYLVADLLLHSGVAGSATHEDDSYIGAQPSYSPARIMDQPTYPAPVLSVRPSATVDMQKEAPAVIPAEMTDGRTADGPRTATKTTHEDSALDVETPRKAYERKYHCKRCGQGPMSFSELGRHSRQCKQETA